MHAGSEVTPRRGRTRRSCWRSAPPRAMRSPGWRRTRWRGHCPEGSPRSAATPLRTSARRRCCSSAGPWASGRRRTRGPGGLAARAVVLGARIDELVSILVPTRALDRVEARPAGAAVVLRRDSNSGSSHPAQTNVPLRFSSLSGLENGRSVPSCRSTSNCPGGEHLAPLRFGLDHLDDAGVCASAARPREHVDGQRARGAGQEWRRFIRAPMSVASDWSLRRARTYASGAPMTTAAGQLPGGRWRGLAVRRRDLDLTGMREFAPPSPARWSWRWSPSWPAP